ncbi:MAG: tetratricopeptide repeat protein [Zavarzinella sp.]
MKTLQSAISAYETGNHSEALGIFQQLSAQSEAIAMRYLGRMCANGEGLPANLADAARWYLQAWKTNDEQSAYELESILPHLEAEAAHNEVIVLFAIGLIYQVIKNDPVLGVPWLMKAADQNHPEALQLVGDSYRQGKGVPMDEQLAYRYYHQAAQLGNGKSMYQLGRQYCEGLAGQQPNEEQGLEWYRKSADQGFWPANMALCKLLADRNRDLDDAREVVQRLCALSAATKKECSVSSSDGQWSAVVSDGGKTIGLSGLTMEDLGIEL